ncbi:unnamed protein product, partial [Brenthis ino]
MPGRKSLFIFLMSLAWKCRLSMPLILSGTVALLGRALMFQIRVHTVHTLRESELAMLDDNDDDDDGEDDDDDSWETESTDSWETIVEEVANG